MLKYLEELHLITNLLNTNIDDWNSLYIDYHHPYVERLFMQIGDLRYYLHKIYPCSRESALFHSHPWPSAIKIIEGEYEMGVGVSQTIETPSVEARMILTSGCAYEMPTKNSWHYVRPLKRPSYSIMVSGKPFNTDNITQQPKLSGLNALSANELLEYFKNYYVSKKL